MANQWLHFAWILLLTHSLDWIDMEETEEEKKKKKKNDGGNDERTEEILPKRYRTYLEKKKIEENRIIHQHVNIRID